MKRSPLEKLTGWLTTMLIIVAYLAGFALFGYAVVQGGSWAYAKMQARQQWEDNLRQRKVEALEALARKGVRPEEP